MNIYNMKIQEILELYGTNLKTGLTRQQVEELKQRFGLNILPEKKAPSLFKIFINQCKNPLIYLLLVAAIIITVLGNYTDAIVTLIVVIFNASIGTFHEINSRRTLKQLEKLMIISAIVIREGKKEIIEASELVPGDLIIITEGDQVPADARIIESKNLRVNESILTGESASVEKINQPLEGEKKIFEQNNMIFKATTITSGNGLALIVSTGLFTEIGKIQQSVQKHEEESPLKIEMDRLSKYILIIAIILCGSLLIFGIFSGHLLKDLLAMITALFIGIVPEGLPVVFALALTMGAHRLARKHVLVKNLQAAEGLGRVDAIVIDKTGTLTKNELIVRNIYTNQHSYKITGEGYIPEGEILEEINEFKQEALDKKNLPENLLLFRDGAGLLDSSEKKYDEKTNNYQIRGEPIEAALGVFAQKLNFEKNNYIEIYKSPFNFLIRAKIGIFEKDKTLIAFVSGAPESIFKLFTNLEAEEKKVFEKLVKSGMRVTALAFYREKLEENISHEEKFLKAQEIINKIEFTIEPTINKLEKEKQQKILFEEISLFAIHDTIRPEIYDAVMHARQAGIDIIMATGDHKDTADFIAQRTGILMPGDLSVDGQFLLLENEQIQTSLSGVKVFSRLMPQEKFNLVKLLQKNGKLVAMTGDGINDIPAIVAANIGISMGSGTDATKESADLVLINDSFANILKAVEEGRHIFMSLRRVVWYFFSTNLSELLVITYAFLLRMPLPLQAAHILWLNVVTDGFLDVALSMEPHEKGLLSQKKSSHKIIDFSLLSKILIDGAIMTFGSLMVFLSLYKTNFATAQTMTLVCMAMYQWFNAWNCRSEKLSLFQTGLLKNKWLIGATILVFLLQIIVIYVPALQILFKTVPLTFLQWGLAFLVASSIIFIEELRKAIFRKINIFSHF